MIEIEKIINEHSDYIDAVARNWSRRDSRIDPHDLQSAGYMAVFEAIQNKIPSVKQVINRRMIDAYRRHIGRPENGRLNGRYVASSRTKIGLPCDADMPDRSYLFRFSQPTTRETIEWLSLGLLDRERRILELVFCGMTYPEIAKELGVCRYRIAQLMPVIAQKLAKRVGDPSRADSIRRALRNDLRK